MDGPGRRGIAALATVGPWAGKGDEPRRPATGSKHGNEVGPRPLVGAIGPLVGNPVDGLGPGRRSGRRATRDPQYAQTTLPGLRSFMRRSVAAIASSTCSWPMDRRNTPYSPSLARSDLVHRRRLPSRTSTCAASSSERSKLIVPRHRGPAAARIARGLVVAHPAVEDGDLLARGDGARALDAPLAARVERGVGVAAVVAQPAAGDARIGNDDLVARQQRELRLGRGGGLGDRGHRPSSAWGRTRRRRRPARRPCARRPRGRRWGCCGTATADKLNIGLTGRFLLMLEAEA